MLSLSIVDHWSDTKRIHLIASLTVSGNYPSGGDSIPLTNPLIKSGSSPNYAVASGIGGYNYVVTTTPGAIPMAATLRVYVDSTGLELTTGAYPGGLTAQSIQLYMIFNKFE